MGAGVERHIGEYLPHVAWVQRDAQESGGGRGRWSRGQGSGSEGRCDARLRHGWHVGQTAGGGGGAAAGEERLRARTPQGTAGAGLPATAATGSRGGRATAAMVGKVECPVRSSAFLHALLLPGFGQLQLEDGRPPPSSCSRCHISGDCKLVDRPLVVQLAASWIGEDSVRLLDLQVSEEVNLKARMTRFTFFDKTCTGRCKMQRILSLLFPHIYSLKVAHSRAVPARRCEPPLWLVLRWRLLRARDATNRGRDSNTQNARLR